MYATGNSISGIPYLPQIMPLLFKVYESSDDELQTLANRTFAGLAFTQFSQAQVPQILAMLVTAVKTMTSWHLRGLVLMFIQYV